MCSFRGHHGIAVYREKRVGRARRDNASGGGANHRCERHDGAAHDPARHHQGAPALQGRAVGTQGGGLAPYRDRLSSRRAGAVSHADAGARRVHQALPTPRPAQGVSSHPPLRPARQRRLQGQHRARQGADRRAGCRQIRRPRTTTPIGPPAPRQTIARHAPVAAAA